MDAQFAVMALNKIRFESSGKKTCWPSSPIQEAWFSLAPEIRQALTQIEINLEPPSSIPLLGSSTSTTSESTSTEKFDAADEITESDSSNGVTIVLKPLELAPKNVFEFKKTLMTESTQVKKTSAAVITTKTSIVTTTRGWRNVFSLPISYDVNMIPYGTLLDPENPQLLESTGNQPDGYNRRFAVIDSEIERLYGAKIKKYFLANGIELTTCILSGGEADKRPDAVNTLIDALCEYKCRRREPFLAIGGGVLLDIAGMAACLYRRGVPFVRVPTTLLSIVDASVGVKNGVDYCCAKTDETYKNRIGSFYAPSSCLLDPAFIATQDKRNISNGFGEIVKLALVRSVDLFELLETYGPDLVCTKFTPNSNVPFEVVTRIIDLSIQIMLEELGPNLWEDELERCVDYGHTFSKLLEMVPGVDLMHGEAVNVDGFFCCVISYVRGYVTIDLVERIHKCMKSLCLPTESEHLKSNLAWQSCKDAVEHRHGEQRIPLMTDLGESICVNDITPDELDRALAVLQQFKN